MKSRIRSADPLPNPRHEAFAREIASGKSATQAYINVYGTANRRVASTGGSRLLRQKTIVARIRSLQQAGAARVAMDLAETLDFLARVVRTPAGEVLPSSDLCTRVKRTRDGSLDVWMPNKLACLRLSAKLQGFLNTTGPGRTASQTHTTAQTETPAPPPAGTPIIISEELRASLMARIRAAMAQSPEEPPVVREEWPAQKEAPTGPKERPVPNREPHSANHPRPSTLTRPQRPAHPEDHLAPATPNPPPDPGPSVAMPPQLSAFNYPLSPQQTSRFSRVTPDDTSTLIII